MKLRLNGVRAANKNGTRIAIHWKNAPVLSIFVTICTWKNVFHLEDSAWSMFYMQCPLRGVFTIKYIVDASNGEWHWHLFVCLF